MTQITLTDQQLEYATAMGQQRHRYDQAVGASGSYNINESDNDDHRLDIQGCIAEYAVSLALGREWVGFATDFQNLKADVGSNIQVRSTYLPHGNLILHPKDQDEQVFILVRLHDLPSVEIVGWARGKEVKQPRYWKEPVPNRPCYLYPHQLLKGLPRRANSLYGGRN